MKDLTSDLRNPYNLASTLAMGMLDLRETAQVSTALYGVYCEALQAVRTAIREGADIKDLEDSIDSLGIQFNRIVKD